MGNIHAIWNSKVAYHASIPNRFASVVAVSAVRMDLVKQVVMAFGKLRGLEAEAQLPRS